MSDNNEADFTTTDRLEWIAACCCTFSIEVNGHRANYETVEQAFESEQRLREEATPELIAGCKEHDRIVLVQVYPKTPIGFLNAVHWDVATAIRLACEELGGK